MTQTNSIVTMNQIKRYVDGKEYGKPILLTDVVRYFVRETGDLKKTRNTISAYLNRLVRNNELKKLNEGVFYKTRKNAFGETTINYAELINNVYFYDTEKQERIGYRIGTNVLANIGITNNLENAITIVTNNFNKKRILNATRQNVYLRKPLIEVNNDNYMYLQLLDTVKEIDKYHLVNEPIGRKVADYMDKNDIKVNELFKFAKDYYNKKTLDNLIDLLAN